MSFFAHTKSYPDGSLAPQSEWEPLFTPFGKGAGECQRETCSKCHNMTADHGHLNKVAYWSARFAAEMFLTDSPEAKSAYQWGYLTGLWHDLGKFAPDWQNYLAKASDTHYDEIIEKIDHTTAGAKYAISKSPIGHFIATAIAGHHAGLLDARHESHASLEKRLSKSFGEEIPNISVPPEIKELDLPTLPEFLKQKDPSFSASFFQRMLFSSLVDADFLATEAFMNPLQAALRPATCKGIFSSALALLDVKIAAFGTPSPSNLVATARATVVQDCARAASAPPGIFTLTVPTGGGKTLSSLNFGLRHALAHNKRRIIYVIPFTSIIEQNAAVFRELLASLGENVIIEHHSNLAPELEDNQTTTSRLATENWDAPIVITTAVQFYESLFAAKTSRSRKLHNIANSIVILDEAQCLPVQYLKPCLRVLEELSTYYHTTTVLCTATQPAVAKSADFPIGFPNSKEIIQDTDSLFSILSRVEVTYRGTLSDQVIASELADASQALCIVNTRTHARTVFELLPKSEENFHLSTLMCPQHRLKVLTTVRKRLAENLPVRLISTQLIEAGVDIDFPVVYRSMAGLDSIAQAAGRCNREGKQSNKGQTHVFHSEHTSSERHFAQTANVGHEILDLHVNEPLSTVAVQAYFHKYFHQQKTRWDSKDILADFKFTGNKDLPLLFNYRTAAEKFQLIENQQISVIIPWTDEIKKLIDEQLRPSSAHLHRQLLRTLQRFTVQIYENEFQKNRHQFESMRNGQFHLLICPESHYSDHFGIDFSNEPKTLIC
jgi:CRISPR-associated endonuclease/helicase Cas3